MATATPKPQAPRQPAPSPAPIPPLENGDHLTRPEFERRYDAMPHLKKAELIEGVVYMGSPVSDSGHSRPHFQLIGWLFPYVVATPGVEGGDNGSVRLDLDNMPQPDILLFILPSHGGQVRISPDDYVEGAPEWVGEIASSSASNDLHDKLTVYRRHGVREYVVWRVRDRAIDYFVLRGGDYERLPLSEDGLLRSEVFPGLWLDPSALIAGDRARLAEVARRGLESPEHVAFVDRLRAAEAAGRGA